MRIVLVARSQFSALTFCVFANGGLSLRQTLEDADFAKEGNFFLRGATDRRMDHNSGDIRAKDHWITMTINHFQLAIL